MAPTRAFERLLLTGLLGLSPAGSQAATPGVFHDYALMQEVRPVYEAAPARSGDRYCAPDSIPPAASLVADIRGQLRRISSRECLPESRVSGYRATYRYGDKIIVRETRRTPQERIPVRVTVSPLP